jgi:hypothetical protein
VLLVKVQQLARLKVNNEQAAKTSVMASLLYDATCTPIKLFASVLMSLDNRI